MCTDPPGWARSCSRGQAGRRWEGGWAWELYGPLCGAMRGTPSRQPGEHTHALRAGTPSCCEHPTWSECGGCSVGEGCVWNPFFGPCFGLRVPIRPMHGRAHPGHRAWPVRRPHVHTHTAFWQPREGRWHGGAIKSASQLNSQKLNSQIKNRRAAVAHTRAAMCGGGRVVLLCGYA